MLNFDRSAHNPTIGPRLYFKGNASGRPTVIHFDFVPPDHCSVRPPEGIPCDHLFLNIDKHFTNQVIFFLLLLHMGQKSCEIGLYNLGHLRLMGCKQSLGKVVMCML